MDQEGAASTPVDMSVEDALDIAWAFFSRNPVALEFPDGLLDAAFECVCFSIDEARWATQHEGRGGASPVRPE